MILPTTAVAERAAGLVRAVRSVLAQDHVSAKIIVVANGPRCDHEVLAQLQRTPNVAVVRLEEASFSRALRVGRRRVDTAYFAELDDDDELLPGAFATQIERMATKPRVDVVVTSGFVRAGGRDERNFSDFASVRADPVRAVLNCMWLVPCGALYRAESVTADLFDEIPGSLEWTYLALRLALTKRIAFVDVPTFVYDRDTPNSLSKSNEWVLAQPAAIRKMQRLDVPPDVRSKLRAKYRSALHAASMAALHDGRRARAWWWHAMSLGYGAWGYLGYTRYLVKPRPDPGASR